MNDEPRIPLVRLVLGEAEVAAARRVLLSGWLTQGLEVRAFEDEFAAFAGAKQAIAVTNGTAAIELVLHALDIGAGSEVVTVSHSFIATANAVRRSGAMPIFVDITPGSFNIDPDRVAAGIGSRTRAILVVHQIGMPCDLTALVKIADAHGLPLIEDAACAVGSEICWRGEWQKIGRPHGVAACFSFHPRKILTTGEGGMITTGDVDLAARLRRLRVHGIDVDADVRHRSGVIIERYAEPGFNMRMTDMQAAIGRVQLAGLAKTVARRRDLARRYVEKLAGICGIGLPQEPDWARSNWQSYCIGLPPGCDQFAVMSYLMAEGIASRRGILCAHREPAYPAGTWSCMPDARHCDCPAGHCIKLTESEKAQDRSIQIPLFGAMTEAELDSVATVLAEACHH
ncbi:MAG: DegT/DnrJ/EryC1/StrS family aminotransferase [Pseudolabrys sp.]